MLLQTCNSYDYNIIFFCTLQISFLSARFLVRYRFLYLIFLSAFSAKSPSVTVRYVSQEITFKKSKNFRNFFTKTKGSNNSFNWKQLQVFKIAKFEFKATVQCASKPSGGFGGPFMYVISPPSTKPKYRWKKGEKNAYYKIHTVVIP